MLPLQIQFVIAMITHALNERANKKLEYALEEVRVLKEQLEAATGKSRIAFTADQRRRLAIKGKDLSPEERRNTCQVVKPETILAWFRQLSVRKYDSSRNKVGRPRKPRDIRKLVIKLALANPTWGYTKLRDALRKGLGVDIERTTIANILAEEGITPAPERGKQRTWKRFLKIHWDSLYACDFFSVEVLTAFGTARYMVFFFIEVKTRAVHIAGLCVDPCAAWVEQIMRNVTDSDTGFLRAATHLIHDGDPLFTDAVMDTLSAVGVTGKQIPAKSPNCNPHAERFVRTIRQECLRHFLNFRRAAFGSLAQ